MEGMWTRFLPAVAQLRAWLADGVIGEIRQVRADLGFQAPKNPEDVCLIRSWGRSFTGCRNLSEFLCQHG